MFNAPSAVVAAVIVVVVFSSFFFLLFQLFFFFLLPLLLTAALEPDAAQRGSYIDSLSAWHCFYERLQLPQFAATVVVVCNSLQSF